LLKSLREEFERELERSMQRIRDALAPYERFVRGERDRTESFIDAVRGQLATVADMRSRLEQLGGDPISVC
jgi:hypothetical protein